MKQATPQQTVGGLIASEDQVHNLREEFLFSEMRLAAVGGDDQLTDEIVLRGGASLVNESLNIARISNGTACTFDLTLGGRP